MLKKVIKYVDYNDAEREETFYFNLSKVEVAEMEMSVSGGWVNWVEKVVEAQSEPELISIFKEVVLKAYGEKSPDGRRFIKSEELSKAFSETRAFEELFMELATDADAAAVFFNGIVPTMEVE
jgi:hypothetical protein